MNKLYACAICLVLFAQMTFAASIKVKHFAELSRDISNRTELVKDINDEPCAIVKVVGADASFTFEGNIVNRKRNGKGKEYQNGDLTFEGNYLD